MHAVVIRVTINEGEGSTKYLREEVVPRVSQAPGFVAGYWVRLEDGNQGASTIVFETEEQARGASEQIHPPPGGEASIESVTVGEVVAHA
jgi:hypothetical protein